MTEQLSISAYLFTSIGLIVEGKPLFAFTVVSHKLKVVIITGTTNSFIFYAMSEDTSIVISTEISHQPKPLRTVASTRNIVINELFWALQAIVGRWVNGWIDFNASTDFSAKSIHYFTQTAFGAGSGIVAGQAIKEWAFYTVIFYCAIIR
jgi:hypothetical protein